jgi:TRAP-type C4-dicarboxylate transport system substrate-binding protein
MIDLVPVPPFLANALQYNRYVGHMIDMNWVPMVGAAIVRRDTWEKISPEVRKELLKIAADTGEKFRVRRARRGRGGNRCDAEARAGGA